MRRLAGLLGLLSVLGPAAVLAASRPYALPPDRAPVSFPPGAGADVTAATCGACHSLDYLTNQPRGKGAQFWKDSVAKMINVYGAPIGKEDAEAISAYLGAIYGGAPAGS